jgi:MazG family protein
MNDEVGARFARLVDVMRTLRGRDGCPWDLEQTLESLRPFVLQEAYEVVEAIDRGDRAAVIEEIGDLILEGVFLAQICTDEGGPGIATALDAITSKLIRRHPHIFTSDGARVAPELALDSAKAVKEQWERVKDRERAASGRRGSVLDGIGTALPSLLRAHAIGSRAAAVGFDWATAPDVLAKVEEEVAELRRAVEHEDRGRREEEMGDVLFALANLSRKLGIEPESALRRANDKFAKRFARLEQRLEQKGTSVHDATLPEMEAEWSELKQET